MYTDEGKYDTTRTLRPLALFFFNPVWLLASWCEKRDDFRNFRLDRIQSLKICEEAFEDESNKNLTAYMAKSSRCNS
jgi:predicted DNA-binding transcriptional regulator YafY